MARIAIAGAGPAGASAACHLAARGHRVVLFDRAEFPRPKTCGDWITPGAVSELAALGLGREAIRARASELMPIRETVLIAPSGVTSRQRLQPEAYCIPRLVFDAMLLRQAVAAGARFERRAIKSLAADNVAFLQDWDYVIDARGAHAGRANAVALRAYWTIPHAALEPGDAHAVRIHTDAEFGEGYGWIFPVAADAAGVRFNLGVGTLTSTREAGRDVRDFFDRFERVNPVLGRWAAVADRTRPVGCHVGLGLASNRVSEGRVLRVGDAANVADPLTGDGIGHALKSGRLAAEAIDAAADGGAASRWQQAYERVIQPEVKLALRLQALLTATGAKNAAARSLTLFPPLRRRIHGAVFNEISYRQALTRL
jgi:flavin-dependent dehydrogenase